MTIGHNSKRAKAAPVVNGRVKSFIERVERLEEERQGIGSDIRDVYAEAKGVGYDVKTLRWMVQERKIDAADRAERDALRETYANALSMAVELVRVEGLSLRQAEEITGASKSSIQRALAVPELSHVEMHADDLGAAEPIREMTEADLGDPLLVIDKPRAQFREKVRAAAASVKVSGFAALSEPKPQAITDTWDDIVRDHPTFLRRSA